jgi:hypothetical protein
VKFEDGPLLDHHPGDPGIGHGQQHQQANDDTGVLVEIEKAPIPTEVRIGAKAG